MGCATSSIRAAVLSRTPMDTVRVVHFVNQFFGGLGGEERALTAVQVQAGPVGSARALQNALGNQAEIVATIIGGDNYMSEQREAALASVRAALEKRRPAVVVAGPAFDAGRYGLACGEVCRLAGQMGIAALTAMHPHNAAVALFRRDVPIVPTTLNATGMTEAVAHLARLVLKLGTGG